jgi:hypothetical protein
MSVFAPIKSSKERSKVHNSQYIRTENKPDEGTKPAETETPTQPDAK